MRRARVQEHRREQAPPLARSYEGVNLAPLRSSTKMSVEPPLNSSQRKANTQTAMRAVVTGEPGYQAGYVGRAKNAPRLVPPPCRVAASERQARPGQADPHGAGGSALS